jgi:protein MPE1
MSSSIFFKFKSRKDVLQINFDGTSLSVFEVKREIMSIARLGDGKDVDLDIYTSDTMESEFVSCFPLFATLLLMDAVYDDDTTQIPRSTTVVARRLPASRPGAGRAARYVTGQMPLRAKNQHRAESSSAKGRNGAATNGGFGDGSAAMTEQERLQAVMNASNTQLKADLAESGNKPMPHRNYNKNAAIPDKPPPAGYECHRCGKKGHWIQACPTNNDPTFDNKPRPKKTTGIPRSMLEYIDDEEAEKIKNGEIEQGQGIWKDGDRYVKVKNDEATWQKIQDQRIATAEQVKEIAKGDEELRARGLECDIDKRPFADPVKTPCCGKTYCRDCIENTLLDSDLLCPNCGEQALLDKLEPDDETAKKLIAFEAEKKAEKSRKDKEASKSPVAASTPTTSADPAVKSPDVKRESAADSPGSATSNSKKRGATEELENNRRPPVPTGPRSMTNNQQQQANNNNNPMAAFHNQMNAMSGAMMTPMMNPMMGMGMGMPPMGMGMPMGNGMGMNSMMGMGMNNMGMPGPMMGGQGMGMGGGFGGMNGGGGMMGGPQDQQAYFRQPVNPQRFRGKQRRQRSPNYKQV